MHTHFAQTPGVDEEAICVDNRRHTITGLQVWVGGGLAPGVAGQGQHVADDRGHVRCTDRAVVHDDGAVSREDKGGEEQRVVLGPEGVVGGPGPVKA